MSAVNRAAIIDRNLLQFLDNWTGKSERAADLGGPARRDSHLSRRGLLDLVDSQFQSRHLDFEARNLKARNVGFYTIGSTGHEGNAGIAAALRFDDPAFLHYRSGAFFCQRAKQVPGQTPLFDILLGMVASREDPIAGGRHKVFGSRPLWIPPQTSTIASHLPKSVGAAIALKRAKRLGLSDAAEMPRHEDAIIVCSFGDASANHSTAVGAINHALLDWFKGRPVPILFVCEDNDIGISVPTPAGWIEDAYGDRNGLAYVFADGLDLVHCHDAAVDAVEWCRTKRQPTFLHMKCVRLLGHAGSDVETEYHTRQEIEAVEARDPLIASCRIVLEEGIATREDLLAMYEATRARVAAAGREAATRPPLRDAADVMAPLAFPGYDDEAVALEAVAREAERADYAGARAAAFGAADPGSPPERSDGWGGGLPGSPPERSDGWGGGLPEDARKPRHLAVMISLGLKDLLAKYPEMIVFGEDVAKKGGVYHATDGLQAAFGEERVFDTVLDEQSILGLGIGAGHLGLLPVPEIQYLAYYHNAEDQIRGEAGSLQFFSKGQYKNPMVVRIGSFGYQKGFGGHFHNDNSIAALRDVPGIVIAAPARGDDAVGMQRTALALARLYGSVVLFLEPIALYMTKDLYEPGDELWSSRFPAPGTAVPFQSARVYPTPNLRVASAGDPPDGGKVGADLSIVTYANGVHLSLRAARVLEKEHGVKARVCDLRWLQPLDAATICAEAKACGRVLVVDECRMTGGLSEAIFTALIEGCGAETPRMARCAGLDTYIPLGGAWKHVLPSEEGVVAAALALVKQPVGAAD
jgi:2-oxoisovalerate dehydrogenase E1 component